jgi:hypothetical protein
MQTEIKGAQDAASLNLAGLGRDLSGTLGNQLRGNFSLGNEETEKRLFDLGSKRLDPRFAREQDDLATRLSNQGIKVGSDAYDREMSNFGQNKNDAYNQLLLSGRGQAAQESLTEDNQRINQISALLNGGQVSQPNFMGANIGGIPTTDNAGIIANYDQQKLAGWQMEQAQKQNMLGGLFSFGSGLIGLSDRRAKKDIKPAGKVAVTGDDGKRHRLGVFDFRYKGQGSDVPKARGLMAQDVAKVKPSAVLTLGSGLKAVNYTKALQ